MLEDIFESFEKRRRARGLESRQTKDNSIGFSDREWKKRVYRIFSWKWLVTLFQKKEMGLLRASEWGDPFENFFLKCKVRCSDGRIATLEQIEKSWYGQCWTTAADSDAMWRIYSRDKDGVRLCTTIERLFATIWDENDEFNGLNNYVGKVHYYKRSAIEQFMKSTAFWDIASGGHTEKFAALLCVKRTEFRHEKEVRVLRHDQSACSKVVTIGLEPNKIFDDVVLDPRLDADEFDCQKKLLENAGCILPIRQSQLYKVDPNVIIEEA